MTKEAQYRYPGVLPFREDQQHLFFGRDQEIEKLYGLISSEKLLVLYGRSGYGKSSLIKAGLFPRFDRENKRKKRYYLPVYVRFNIHSSEDDDLFDKYYFHLEEALEENEIAPHPIQVATLPYSLWATMKRWHLPTNATVVLVFDQFEEFFTYSPDQQREFELQLAELLYTAYPLWLEEHEDELNDEELDHLAQPLDVKALFAIRSDRMSELDGLRRRLPAILHKRLELTAFDEEQAKDAIVGPALRGSVLYEGWRGRRSPDHTKAGDFISPSFEYSTEAKQKIIAELSQNIQHGKAKIEAFLLQLLCRSIEEKAINGTLQDIDGNGVPNVQPSDVPQAAEVFSLYYNSTLDKLPSDKRPVIQRMIENRLIRIDPRSKEGRRVSVDTDTLLDEYQEGGLDTDLLKQLESLYLLRKERNSVGTHNYEISHDTLVPSIVQARMLREVKEKQEEREQELAERLAEEREESKRREEELELENKRREAALRQEQRKRRRDRIALVLSVLVTAVAVMSSIWAIQAREEADIQTTLAIAAEKEADSLLLVAETQNVRLEEQRNTLQTTLTQLELSEGQARAAEDRAERNLLRMQRSERERRLAETKKYLDTAERMIDIQDTTMAIQILLEANRRDPSNAVVNRRLKELQSQ